MTATYVDPLLTRASLTGSGGSVRIDTTPGDDALVKALEGVREVDGPNTVMQELKGQLGGPTSDD